MRIAVTGAHGLLGRAVVAAALAHGHEVAGIDRSPPPSEDVPPGLTSVPADVRSYADLERAAADCSALVHLAAHPTPHDRPAYEVHDDNVTGSYHALSVAANLGMTHVCMASSVNAIGGGYSRSPRYDYFPIDELHPTYNEDPYSLSKWIAEAQADSFARRYDTMTISSLRMHSIVTDVEAYSSTARQTPEASAKHLWGYTSRAAAASACLLALSATFTGHQAFYVVAPHTITVTPSRELRDTYYPDVPLRRELSGNEGFFDCTKAEKLLGWQHDPPPSPTRRGRSLRN